MKAITQTDFDIVLTFTNFRRSASYLSIVKYLSGQLRIGILRVPIDRPEKTINTDLMFLNLCKAFGANVLETDQPVSTNILIIPQWPYSNEAINSIKSRVKESKNNFMMCSLTWAGFHDAFLNILNINKILIIDKGLFHFLLKEKDLRQTYPQEVIEIGLPFEKYRIFNEQMNIDYLIAVPTPFSFPKEEDKIIFLENVLRIVNEIKIGNPNNIIVLKKHNALEEEYFVNPKMFLVSNLFYEFMSKLGLSTLPNIIGRSGIKSTSLKVNLLYAELLKKVVPFQNITPYSDLPLEIFLPSIKRGVIGGLSNTMWHALYFKKPFYNCVPEYIRRTLRNDLTLTISLRYFGVPACDGELSFDVSDFNKISNDSRQCDLIEILRNQIE